MQVIRPFKGAGEIALARYDSAALFDNRNFFKISNASEFNRTATEETQKVKNFMGTAGGTWASASRVDTIDASIVMYNWSPKNLALVCWGETNSLTATAITGESHTVRKGAFVPTKRIINTAVAPVLKKGATTIDADDYTYTTGGVEFKDTFETVGLVDDDTFTIDYTPKAGFNIQALIQSAPLVSVSFDGANAYDGKACTDKIWKARLGIAKDFGLIGSDIQSLSLSLSIEQDSTIVGVGLSQYFEHQAEL